MIEIDTIKFGKNFKKIRKDLGYTQESLAELINTTHASIQRWESGQHKPSFVDFYKLMQALELSFEELAGIEPLAKRSKATLPEALDVVREEMGLSLQLLPGYEIKKKSLE